MPTTYNKNSLPSTYNDDWRDSAGFHQILFNSGRALQARELTQLQTIIHKEIERLGENVFKGGAAVNAGSTKIDLKKRFAKISSFSSPDSTLSFGNIPLGLELTGNDSGVKAKVVESVSAVDSDPNTIYVQYIDQGNEDAGATSTEFTVNETITGGGWSFVVSGVGSGTEFTVDAGDFFALGHFVHAKKQSIFLSKYTNSGINASVGYKVTQDIVTVNDDESLYDNSGGIANTSSPGADRYRITLTLINENDVASDETFIKIASVENNIIVDTVTSFGDYNQINELLAQRTYEESGNYILEPFFTHMEENADPTKLDFVISSGTAYVKGHRAYKPSATRLVVPKPTQTETVQNNSINIDYGNYVIATGNAGFPHLFDTVELLDEGLGIIGSAKIRSVEKYGNSFKVYLFDILITITDDENFRQVRYIGSGGERFALTGTGQTGVEIQDAANNVALFETPRPRPSLMTSVSINVQREFTTASDGNGETTISVTGNESFTDTSLWIASANGTSADTISVTLSNNNQTANISGLTSGQSDVNILAIVNNSNASIATKTLAETSSIFTLSTGNNIAGSTINYIDLDKFDIHSVSEIKADNENGEDLSPMFILDHGQRDNFYEKGRLILKSSDVPPTNIYVKFKYFSRTTPGSFYAAQSYSGVDYKDIPAYTQTDGQIVSLRNVLDFRPDRNRNGTLVTPKEMPISTSNLTANVSYYLPRADKIIISENGEISVLMGEQDKNPKFKSTPNNSLTLYKVLLNANTFGPSDVNVTAVDHRRYTMADIRDLEDKIDKLEETTTLSLLELESKLSQLFDSDGNLRLESGFVVDNFSDQIGSDTKSPEYYASIDPESRTLRPGFDEDNIRLVPNTTTSSGVVIKGDNAYLSYDSASWKSNLLASKSIPINPFNGHAYIGELKLSPSADDWKMTGAGSSYAVEGSSSFDNNEALLWNEWQWNWAGRSAEDVHQTAERFVPRNQQFGAFGRRSLNENEQYYSDVSRTTHSTSSAGHVNRVFFSETIRTRYGQRYVDVALIPWIRSKKVYFKASGLKPNTKFIPYFDGKRFDDWVKEESTFVQSSSTSDDLGDTYSSLSITEHPDGKQPLISDDKGEIIGSFFIPSNTENRFRSGKKEFKLLDITENDYNAAGSKAIAYYTTAGLFNNDQQNVTSTREPESVSPIQNNLSMPISYVGRDTINYLNNVADNDVFLVEPHLIGLAQQNAAQINPADYAAGMSSVLSDYVSVDQNQLSGTSTEAVSVAENPMAQSFYVDNPFGVVLTKINLFFSAKDNHLPVMMKIRPMIDGTPSTQVSVPGSSVVVNSSDVNVVAESNTTTISNVLAKPTAFVFDEPVHLNPWTEYALVVSSPSSDYKIYVGDAKEYVLGSTSKKVSPQETTSQFFMPQVGTSWSPSGAMNLMFSATRANFKTNGSLILENVNLPGKLLKENPIKTQSGSTSLYVNHRHHGLSVGEMAIISGLDSLSTFAGISAANINGNRVISAVDLNGYTIDAGSAANVSSYVGGANVIAGRNIQFDVVSPQINKIIPNSTSTVVASKLTTGKSISGSETKYVQDVYFTRIVEGENTSFNHPKIIANETNETAYLAGNSSATIKVDLKSGNNYVSPIIDLQRCSLTLVGNVIDDSSSINPIMETDPRDGSAGSKHVTTVYDLVNDAVGMQILFDYNVPPEANLEVYFRTSTDGQNFYQNIEDTDWVLQETISPLVKNANPSVYSEGQALPGGSEGTLTAFNRAQVKLVMKSTNSAAVPTVKNLRIKFLAT